MQAIQIYISDEYCNDKTTEEIKEILTAVKQILSAAYVRRKKNQAFGEHDHFVQNS